MNEAFEWGLLRVGSMAVTWAPLMVVTWEQTRCADAMERRWDEQTVHCWVPPVVAMMDGTKGEERAEMMADLMAASTVGLMVALTAAPAVEWSADSMAIPMGYHSAVRWDSTTGPRKAGTLVDLLVVEWVEMMGVQLVGPTEEKLVR